MKKLLLTISIVSIAAGVSAQSRLEPSDSLKVESNWYKETPYSFFLTSSVLPELAVNTGHQNLYNHLEGLDIETDKLIQTFSFGMGLRWKKSMLEVSLSQSIPVDGSSFSSTLGGDVSWDESLRHFDVSYGYIVHSNNYFALVPHVGLGYSRYTYHYFISDQEATFDFNDQNGISLRGSPRLEHENGYWDIGIDMIYGLTNQRKGHVFQGAGIGYRQGWNPQDWKGLNTNMQSSSSDRIGQFYINIVFGFSFNYKKNK